MANFEELQDNDRKKSFQKHVAAMTTICSHLQGKGTTIWPLFKETCCLIYFEYLLVKIVTLFSIKKNQTNNKNPEAGDIQITSTF